VLSVILLFTDSDYPFVSSNTSLYTSVDLNLCQERKSSKTIYLSSFDDLYFFVLSRSSNDSMLLLKEKMSGDGWILGQD